MGLDGVGAGPGLTEGCEGFTPVVLDGSAMAGVAEKSILEILPVSFSSQAEVLEFVGSIPNVQVIELCNVHLRETILFELLESCPSLEEIILALTYGDCGTGLDCKGFLCD